MRNLQGEEHLPSWQPATAPEARRARARLNAGVRAFFADRGVLEVETPLWSRGAPTDPAIESWQACSSAGICGYLQTSPEYPMKRLLAAGAGDIYQMARVFRAGEWGPRHNPEFTLLEWYRLGFDHGKLMDEVVALLLHLLPLLSQTQAQSQDGGAYPVRQVRYADLFHRHLQLDPLTCTVEECAQLARAHGMEMVGTLDRDAWLDALLTWVILPHFPENAWTFIQDYPESQAILARPCPDQPGYARRFELYWGTLELANGFHELTDAAVFLERQQRDIAKRQALGLEVPRLDEAFRQAMEAGLPACAGVALGMDRLLMRLLGYADLRQVIDFPWDRV